LFLSQVKLKKKKLAIEQKEMNGGAMQQLADV
jgi:hypothetical protein